MLFNYAYSHLFDAYDPRNVLLLLAVVAVVISFLSNLFRYLGSWTIETMRARTLQRMRNEMFSRVMDMNVGYFSEQRKGDIISKITSDIGVVQFCITNTLQVSFREPFLIVGYIVMMVAISWELSIFSILFLPVVALIIGSIVKRLRHPARTNQHRMGEMVSTLEESLAGIKVIKSYNATRYVKRKFFEISADLARLTLSMARRQQLASPDERIPGHHGRGRDPRLRRVARHEGIARPGRIHRLRGHLLPDHAPRAHLHRPVRQHQPGNRSRRAHLLGDRHPARNRGQARRPGAEGAAEKIEFRDVHFSYDGQREVIDGISFEIRRGETVALVGPSGGGKSTLSELLPRFYDPASGEIAIDGIRCATTRRRACAPT